MLEVFIQEKYLLERIVIVLMRKMTKKNNFWREIFSFLQRFFEPVPPLILPPAPTEEDDVAVAVVHVERRCVALHVLLTEQVARQ